MNFKFWNTKISDYTCVIGVITQDEQGELKIRVRIAEVGGFEITTFPEIYEIGSEQHFFDWWKILNEQNIKTPRTTLIVENSEWIKNFSTIRENENDYKHFLILGIDKVINIIAETEPLIEKIY